MKLEPVINFIHAVQSQVLLSDICDSVSFGADDKAQCLEVLFSCREKFGVGVTANSYVARKISYIELFDGVFDPQHMARFLVNEVEN